MTPGPKPAILPETSSPGNLGGTRGRRVEPLALLDVGTVQARGHDVDQHLAGAGHGGFDLTDFQDLGSAGL